MVSRTADDTLRVLCGVLCVVCVVGVQCVGVGVCVCWCWCWCVTLTLSSRHLSPCVRSKRFSRVFIQNVPSVYRHHARKCYHMRAWWRYTRMITRCFLCVTPHRTHTPRPQRHTHKTQQQPPQQHTETGTERDREREKERQRKTDKRRRDKTRRQEKKAREEKR